METTSLLAVALGGALGALLRAQLLRLGSFHLHSPDRASARLYPALSTLMANTIGCLVLGDWLAGAPLEQGTTSWLGDFVAVGLCGGLTTFSTLCGDTIRLARVEGPAVAAAYVGATFVLGTGGLWMGLDFPPL